MATILLAGVVAAPSLRGQGADRVVAFTPGEMAGYGFEQMPGNVLGLPDPTARPSIPATDPAQILSLGLGGEIVLAFDGRRIVDQPGPDLSVFENAFAYRLGGRERIYAEPAQLSVSSDGERWIAFPFDSLTLVGCAGVTPTNGEGSPLDPDRSGGDQFDLATIGADSIRFIRIRDVTEIVRSHPEHPFYDFTLNGFDLDAVVALHVAAESPADAGSSPSLPRPARLEQRGDRLLLELMLEEPGEIEVIVIDLLGRLALHVERTVGSGATSLPIELRDLRSSLYLCRVFLDGQPLVTRSVEVVR